jgi:hypothetical protein
LIIAATLAVIIGGAALIVNAQSVNHAKMAKKIAAHSNIKVVSPTQLKLTTSPTSTDTTSSTPAATTTSPTSTPAQSTPVSTPAPADNNCPSLLMAQSVALFAQESNIKQSGEQSKLQVPFSAPNYASQMDTISMNTNTQLDDAYDAYLPTIGTCYPPMPPPIHVPVDGT